jgi:hypothetical protein
MLATLVALVVQIAGDDVPNWVAWTSLALAAGPILLAGLRTVPNAVRLGARLDGVEGQSRLAREVYRDHVLCLAGIVALLMVQLGLAR